VYDHSTFEENGRKDWGQRQIEDGAKKIVDDAVRHLKDSVAPRASSESLSSSLLSTLRTNNSVGVSRESCPVDLLSRLKRLFEYPFSAYTTNEVLSRFSDVDDKFAAVFKQMLREVARLQDGKW
jgi:hypothetical protein